jgi:sec-independent protein translocase protein TatC
VGKSAKHSHQPTTLYDHIRELQMRFLAVFATLTVASFIVYAVYEPILAILSSPLNAPLYYSSPSGGFAFIMKICVMGALIITMPVLAYNLIMFVRPAFEKFLPMKRVFVTAGTSTILAIAGALFAFYCILPGSLAFFKGFDVSGLSALISADNYLGFVTNLIITFIVIFQLPLVIAFIDKIKPLQPKRLLKLEKWVVLGSLIISLILPFTYDFVTSILIAVPIIVLYNLSILIVVFNHASAARKVQAVVIKPVLADSTNTSFALDEQVFDNFAEELAQLEKPQPAQPIVSKRPVSIAKGVMDVNLKAKPQQTVEPAAWVLERKLRREAIMKQMYAFSEVNRHASVKRVGAN